MDVKKCLFFSILSSVSCSVIIPEELPSLLSVAYSNIPPIKKGTDSRVGFGFAFGNHADFQVVLELGPQTNTMNLTGQPFGSQPASNAKRQAPSPPQQNINKNREKFLQSDAGKYLQNWAQKMKYPKPVAKVPFHKPGDVPNLEDSVVELVKNSKGEYEIHQPNPGMPSKILDDLRRLYGQKKAEAQKSGINAGSQRYRLFLAWNPMGMRIRMTEKKRSDAEVEKITADLSNVDLD